MVAHLGNRLLRAVILSRSVFLGALALIFVSLPAFAGPLDGTLSFGYQLQQVDVEELASSPFDVLIVDYSRDGTERTALGAADIQRIRDGKPGRKVLAYLSIGEAETYRYYFRKNWIERSRGRGCKRRAAGSAPGWLGPPNPDFCENFKVRFWQRAWQRIVIGTSRSSSNGYLDKIIRAGFDGVYLDIIDGFRAWDRDEGDGSRPGAARDMVKFVQAIADHARIVRGKSSFAVVPQNGADILGEISDGERSRYLAAIDGIGAEDTFYFGDDEEDNPLDPQSDAIAFLDQFRAAGKVVLAIDYLTSAVAARDFAVRACAKGYIPQVGVRALDSLKSQVLRECATGQ